MHQLHVILDSPTRFPVTKTEIDIGAITQPYEAIAQCIRAVLCISHDLRRWARITICFDQLGPLTLTLDPNTIRFLGTDERSILHIIMRGQKANEKAKKRRPYGVSTSHLTVHEFITRELSEKVLLLLPSSHATWMEASREYEILLMYCPLRSNEVMATFTRSGIEYYRDYHRRDLAILRVIYDLESNGLVVQKD